MVNAVSLSQCSVMAIANPSNDDAEFRGLVNLIRKPRVHSDEQVLEAISSVSRSALNRSNRNGKSPLHFCAQIRECPELTHALVSAKADIDRSTRRGHTGEYAPALTAQLTL